MSAGMFFCESKFLNEIPFDPTLDYLFEGEEILTSVKFYTNGWDIFTPKENIIYHEYGRENKPKYYIDNNKIYNPNNAILKVKQLLSLENENNDEKYGLGKLRTLKSFYSNATILPNTNKTNNSKNSNLISLFILILLLFIIILVLLIA
jgi:hypothetical protein